MSNVLNWLVKNTSRNHNLLPISTTSEVNWITQSVDFKMVNTFSVAEIIEETY